MKRSAHFAAAVILAATLARADPPLPAPIAQDAARPMQKTGSASLHWFGIRVYDIALYSEGDAYSTNTTAALSIRYAVRIRGKRLVETTMDEWERMGIATAAERAAWLAALAPMWPDVHPGERLTAFRRNDGQTDFYFDDRLVGSVPDPDFGPAFFAIWLGEKCKHPDVRDRLLGTVSRKGKG
ncbi:MAG: hypothetical protein FJ224_11115 [Lentisphaerae bacterium]|nr:hypothetical protein [Lentisphaerota bacterium]